jgi:hypothetical protein
LARAQGVHCSFFDHPPPSLPLAPRYRVARDHGLPALNIRGVIGPDEYHEHIDDNAYTNVMARWNIRRALEVAALLRERWPDRWARLTYRLGLQDTELLRWRTVAETMFTGWNSQTGLFEQFAGFFDLEEIDLAGYAGRSVPMDVVLGRERTQRGRIGATHPCIHAQPHFRRTTLIIFYLIGATLRGTLGREGPKLRWGSRDPMAVFWGEAAPMPPKVGS